MSAMIVRMLQPATAVRSHLAFSIVLGALFVVVNIPDVTSYPLIADDEVLLNEPARVLAFHGTLQSPMLSPDHSSGQVLVQPPVQALAVSAVYRISGFGLWQTRVAGLLWGAAAIALVAFVACGSDRDWLRGWIAAVFVALMPMFVLGARMGRMDALCLAFALAAFAALERGRQEDRWHVVTFLAGLLTALACLTHFVAFGFLGALLVLQARGPATLEAYRALLPWRSLRRRSMGTVPLVARLRLSPHASSSRHDACGKRIAGGTSDGGNDAVGH